MTCQVPCDISKGGTRVRKGNRTILSWLVVIFMLAAIPLNAPTARASTATQLRDQINGINGLTATQSGNVITVTGGAVAASQVTLNIDAGVTVNWDAIYSGALSARYILILQGAGTFNLSGSIVNTASGAVSITGSGGTKFHINGGSLTTSGTGVTLNITVSDVLFTVSHGGTVNNSGSNSAVNIGAGLTGVEALIDGGSVTSIPNGTAIHDSGNNTKVSVINGGSVQSGGASAIRSDGPRAKVSIHNGTVTNSGTTAANPTIYMTAVAGPVNRSLVTIGGTSVVQNKLIPTTTSQTPFAIQTGGDVTVQDNALVTASTRAINLVGTDSVATIDGGTVSVTGTGTNCYALCTATDNPANVPNTKIIVKGGLVYSPNGNAIRATGANTSVAISGGRVTSDTGNAIHTIGAKTEINVSGNGNISTGGNGNAIYSTGSDTVIFIDGPATDSCFVTATHGLAINATGANAKVTISRGFVFAYGTLRDHVIKVPAGATLDINYTNCFIIAWNYDKGVRLYAQSMKASWSDDLGNWSSVSTYNWYHHADLGGGIYFSGGVTGFFPVKEVTIYRDFGLLFMVNESLRQDTKSYGQWDVDKQLTSLPVNPCKADGNSLRLNGFSWNTSCPYALTVFSNSPTEQPAIHLTGSSMLASLYTPDDAYSSYGINISPDTTLTIEGLGTLEVKGKTGAINAQDAGQLILPDAYIYWSSTDPQDPGGAGTIYVKGSENHDNPYIWRAEDKYFKISTLPFALVDNVTVTGLVGDPLVTQQAVVTLYGGAEWKGGNDVPASGWFRNLPAVVTVLANGESGAENTIRLHFTGTPFVGSNAVFDITIPESVLSFSGPGAGAIQVIPNPSARFDFKAQYNLIIIPGEGGAVTVAGAQPNAYIGGTFFGKYPEGTPISTSAVPEQGFLFTGWLPIGVTVTSETENETAFTMPPNTVTLTAAFGQNLYLLTVENGTGGGYYPAGAPIKITANAPPKGQEFVCWVSAEGGVFDDETAMETLFTMPENDVTVSAVYRIATAIPPTGDNPDILVWGTLLLTSALCGIVLLIWRKRQETVRV